MGNVNVTYQDLRDASRKLRGGKGDIESKLRELRQLVQQLVSGGYTTSSSSKQFETSFDDFHQGASKMMGGLEGMGKYLDSAADAFEKTDQELAKTLRK